MFICSTVAKGNIYNIFLTKRNRHLSWLQTIWCPTNCDLFFFFFFCMLILSPRVTSRPWSWDFWDKKEIIWFGWAGAKGSFLYPIGCKVCASVVSCCCFTAVTPFFFPSYFLLLPLIFWSFCLAEKKIKLKKKSLIVLEEKWTVCKSHGGGKRGVDLVGSSSNKKKKQYFLFLRQFFRRFSPLSNKLHKQVKNDEGFQFEIGGV